MHENMPKISIVIPVLNRVHMLETAIRSVLDQHYPNLELIVIDGGSQDGTVDVIKRFESCITYWHSRPDGSPAAAFSAGVQRATGDRIGFVMSDDWFEPGIFFKIAEHHQRFPEIDILMCGGRLVSYDDVRQQWKNDAVFLSQEKQVLSLKNACFHPMFAICTYFIKPRVFQNIGTFQTHMDSGEMLLANDRDWVVRAALQGCTSRFVPVMGYTIRAHGDSLSFSLNRDTSMRQFREHQWMAMKQLSNSTLTRCQRRILKLWHSDQAVRLFLFTLFFKRKYIESVRLAWKGFRTFPFRWLWMLGVSGLNIAMTKTIKWFNDGVNQND